MTCPKCGVPGTNPHGDVIECADALIAYYAPAEHRCDVCFQTKPGTLECPVMQPPGFTKTMWVCPGCSLLMARADN